MSTELELILAVIAFFAGIGITAIGPGGIFLTIALYSLTQISPAEVAGTASATFVVTGVLGSASYLRSGELESRASWEIAGLLSVMSIVGALLGAELTPWVSQAVFGALLGALATGVGVIIVYQQWRGLEPKFGVDPRSGRGRVVLLALGLGIGVSGGLLGVGGPVLAVPALVVLGVPLLLSVAVAQVQSVFVALFATVGHALNGAVLWKLAFIIGVPQLAGAIVGWRIAHQIDPGRLKLVLGVVLIAVGPYLAW